MCFPETLTHSGNDPPWSSSCRSVSHGRDPIWSMERRWRGGTGGGRSGRDSVWWAQPPFPMPCAPEEQEGEKGGINLSQERSGERKKRKCFRNWVLFPLPYSDFLGKKLISPSWVQFPQIESILPMLVTSERPFPVLILYHEALLYFFSPAQLRREVRECFYWEPHVQSGSSYHTAGRKPKSKLSNVSFAVDSNHYLSPENLVLTLPFVFQICSNRISIYIFSP